MGMKFKKDHFDEGMREQPLRLLIPVIVSVLVIVILSYVARFYSASFSQRTEDWGTLGDYFGGLMNPVISFATLMVAYAVWKLQKSELHDTQMALKEQAKTAELQRQEQRFFDLLRVYQTTVDGLFLEHGEYLKGRAVLYKWFKNQPGHYIKQMPDGQSLQSIGGQSAHQGRPAEVLKDSWLTAKPSNQVFDHYFRVVFRVLNDAELLLTQNRLQYVELFIDQLSQTEIFLLALHLWASEDGHARQTVAREYGLLKHLPKGDFRSLLETDLPDLFNQKHIRSGVMTKDAAPC
jgi:hypothetical protein